MAGDRVLGPGKGGGGRALAPLVAVFALLAARCGNTDDGGPHAVGGAAGGGRPSAAGSGGAVSEGGAGGTSERPLEAGSGGSASSDAGSGGSWGGGGTVEPAGAAGSGGVAEETGAGGTQGTAPEGPAGAAGEPGWGGAAGEPGWGGAAGGDFCDSYGRGESACDLGQILCAGTCVDPRTNVGYCGASDSCRGASAGVVCADGAVCMGGVCRRGPVWAEPRLIDGPGAKGGLYPDVAVRVDGSAVVVWVEMYPRDPNAPGDAVWLNRYHPSTGWGMAELVEANLTEPYYPRVVSDRTGNITVTWASIVRGISFTWLKRYEPATGWGPAFRPVTSRGVGHTSAGRLAMAPDGSTFAVWPQNITQGTGTLFYTRHTASSGWSSAVQLNLPGALDVLGGDVEFDADGSAVFVWAESNGSRYSVWSRRLSPTSGLEPAPVLLEEEDDLEAKYPDLAFDSAGNAVVVWSAGLDSTVGQRDGESIWARVYRPACGWDAPVLLGRGTFAHHPRVAMGRAGQAVVVWRASQVEQRQSGAPADVWHAELDVSRGWTAAVMLASDAVGEVDMPVVTMDGDGNALVVWSQSTGLNGSIWAARRDRTTGWREPQKLYVSEDYEPPWNPAVQFAGNGDATITWHTSRLIPRTIWVRQYH